MLCSICHQNAAVIFMTTAQGEHKETQGICLKCALEKKVPGVDKLLEQSGVTEDNVDEIQSNLNHMMESMGDLSPEDLFKNLLQMDPEAMMGIEAESDEPADEEKRSSFLRQLLPAQRGLPSEEKKSEEEGGSSRRKKARKKKFLDQFGRNLTLMAEQGKLDRIVGRDKELERVIQILNRRGKNNPALIGEPGVGKTAVAQGLALKIVAREVPAKLLDLQVYELDMTAMVAGTQFRGQFESRMKGVVDDAREAGNVVLLIDEMHNIMGAGDAEGAMNAANILKPALAAGEISIIGCTTLEEYRRHIEKDSALERRFQKVMIDEPSPEDCLEVLKGVRQYYEKHHHVHYSDYILQQTIDLACRYIHDRFLPDKAIDILDEAGSRVNLDNHLLSVERELQMNIEELTDEREDLKKQLAESREDQERMRLYQKDADLKATLLQKEAELKIVQAQIKPVEISFDQLAAVVELWTGIPVRRISEDETEKLKHLESRLHERVIGQNQAVEAVAKAIRRKRAGFGKRNKPSSFLFVGPTGVGKTELAKALAEALFDSEEALIRLDMSEYMEPHTVSKLIGSPPGYVGYDDAGQLTERIRRKPYSVILMDEIEKAHADVYNILLQLLDDGRLTDSHGRVVSFANCILIMTSNAGTSLKATAFGFNPDKERAMESRVQTVLKEIFRPEFLNRIDEQIVFSSLQAEEIRQIVDLMLHEVRVNIEARDLKLEISTAAAEALAREGFDEHFGARPLRRCIQRKLEDPLADLLFDGQVLSGDCIKMDWLEGDFTFEIVKRETNV